MPGITSPPEPAVWAPGRASMRPRLNAGDHGCAVKVIEAASLGGFNEAPAECRGSPVFQVRFCPYPDSFNEAPAECRGSPRAPAGHLHQPPASMRPRLNAGDHSTSLDNARQMTKASMRPRLNAGDHTGH